MENLYNLPMPESKPLVAVIMGSKSDWDTMLNAVETLDELGVPNEARVLSAHRTPDATAEFARGAADRHIWLESLRRTHGCRFSVCQFNRNFRDSILCCPRRKCPVAFPSERWP